MLAPMPTAARSVALRRPDITVSITPLIITASWAIRTGQPSLTISRQMEENIRRSRLGGRGQFVDRLYWPVVGRRHVAMEAVRHAGRHGASVFVGHDQVDGL